LNLPGSAQSIFFFFGLVESIFGIAICLLELEGGSERYGTALPGDRWGFAGLPFTSVASWLVCSKWHAARSFHL
jgi:hypothetical protein